MPLRGLYRRLFWLACAIGRPIGGLRPRRIYQWLARRAFPAPEFSWFRNKWGCELRLAPFYHLDCEVISQGTYDSVMQACLERLVRPGMVCMDVGANIGEVALHLARKVQPGGEVHAFEPAPPVLERLKENVDRNAMQETVRVWPVALCDSTGRARFSFAEPATCNQGMGSLVNRSNRVVGPETEVETWSLDDFVKAHGIGRVDFMKVDIQGAEWLLLQGGRKFFSEVGPDLLIEVSDPDLRCGGHGGRELCQSLESLGYSLHELHRTGVGRRLEAASLPDDFSTGNLFCTRKPR